MNPIVSQMVAEDRMATRMAEAAAYRRTGLLAVRRMPWARQVAAGALARLATALDPSLGDGVPGAPRGWAGAGLAVTPIHGRR